MTTATPRPTLIRYRIVGWLTIAAALSYLCRNAVGVTESSIRAELGFSLKQSGSFMGAFFWTYALFQIPSGWLAQHFGTRKSLTVFAIGSSLATLAMGLAPGIQTLIIAQLLMGISQAGFFPASCNSIGHWIPISRRSLACGLLTAGMQLGAISASGLTGALLTSISWRSVFILFSIPGFLWAAVFYLRFRDRPEQVARLNSQELELIHATNASVDVQRAAPQREFRSWGEIALNLNIWLICGQQICRSVGYMFFASWFPTFLQTTRGVSISASGYLQGCVLTGTLIGSVAGGLITDWIWKRTGSLRFSRCGMATVALGGCGLLVLAAWFVEDARMAVALLSLASLFAAIAGPCTFATIIDVGGNRVPEIFGLINMMGNLATAACPILVAWLVETTESWDLVLAVFAGIYILGAVCWALVVPNREKLQINQIESISAT